MHFYLFLRLLVSFLVFNELISSTLSHLLPRVKAVLQSPIIYPVGANVHIECPVYDDGIDLLFFEWSHEIEGPIEESSRVRINDRGVLKIKSATTADSGIYYCKAINGFGSVTTSVELKVVPEEEVRGLSSPLDNQYPIQFPVNDNILLESDLNTELSYSRPLVRDSQPKIIRRLVGISVVLSCSAKSKVQWTKNGRNFSLKQLPYGSYKRKGILTLSKVRIEDSGNYSCIGTDGLGQVNNTFTLIVYDNRKPELTGFHPINTSVVLGERAVFHCKVHSEVKPLIQWLRSYNDVKDAEEARSRGLIQLKSEYYKVLKSPKVIEDGNGNYLNDLIIENTKMSDSGNYICLAAYTHSGYFNFTYKSSYLTVLLPVPKSSQESKDSEGLQISLSAMFWIIVGFVSLIVLLLSIFLCLLQKKSENQINSKINNNTKRGDNSGNKTRDYSYRHELPLEQSGYSPVNTNLDNYSTDRHTFQT